MGYDGSSGEAVPEFNVSLDCLSPFLLMNSVIENASRSINYVWMLSYQLLDFRLTFLLAPDEVEMEDLNFYYANYSR
jgi:hypothetical protein